MPCDATVFASAKTWQLTRRIDNIRNWSLPGVVGSKTVGEIEKDVVRRKTHLQARDGGAELGTSIETLLHGKAARAELKGALADSTSTRLEADGGGPPRLPVGCVVAAPFGRRPMRR